MVNQRCEASDAERWLNLALACRSAHLILKCGGRLKLTR